ncbi:MAG: response regulator [Flavobacteriales bacterium]|nr:response regulator [Flavobacteriales bacterium]MCB9449296.1 response regulator [Flavobacteriales bacterium]
MALNFRNISIRNKLLLISMVVSGLSLILSCAAYLSFEYSRAKEEMVREIMIMGQVIGENNTSPVLFDDSLISNQSLKTLAADENIRLAIIYDRSGKVFSKYVKPGFDEPDHLPESEDLGHRFTDDALEVFIPIHESDEWVSTVYLQSDLGQLHALLRRSLFIILGILSVSLVVVYFVSLRLQSVISHPILRLANVARKISKEKDYSIRIERDGEDEIGILVEGFNEMMTAVQRGNEALLESEERYRTIVENAHDMIYRADFNGYFTYLNPIAKRITGYTDKELLRMNYLDLIHDDWRERVGAFYKKQLLSLTTTTYFEFQIRTKDGRDVWIGQNVEATIENKKVVEFQAVARDITERVKAEEALKVAKEQAESATQAKSTFLANMSHEIRTPMNGVMGMSRLLGDTPLNQEQKEYVQAINVSAENLLTIINDVLDFSKIEAGKVVLEKAPFRLDDLLNTIEKTMLVLAREKGLDFTVECSEQVPLQILSDRVRLNQVLMNLVGNAIKFTEKGGVSLAVHVKDQRDNLYCLAFQVIDTGIGIPQSKLESIFSSFEQATSDTTRKYGGTGLGLSISKELVQLFGGDIHVESKEGIGSTFMFNIWVNAVASSSSNRTPGVGDEEEMQVLAGKKVLVVEDNKINQMLAKKVLTKWGMDVTLADNGRLGVDALDDDQYDAVLMDIQMPEMDGYQATAAIRSHKERKWNSLPIMAITAHAAPEEREKCLKAGMDDYISKPFDEKLLRRKLVELLR